MTRFESVDRALRRTTAVALIVGVVGIALAVVGWLLDPETFFRAWLFGFLTWWQIAIGSLGLAMLYHLAGGHWGTATRPIFDAASRTLPLLAVLFVPVALGLRSIYPWADQAWISEHPLNESRRVYFDEPFFIGRTVVYFAIWIVFAMLLSWRTVSPAGRLNTAEHQRLSKVAAGGMVLLVLTVTGAAVDWLMSLDPFFKSTMFGGIVVAAAGVAGMAFAALLTATLPRQVTVVAEQPATVLNDLGNLLLAFVMVWTYLMFGQFLIIWMGNLPEEVVWYQERQAGGWQTLIIVVVLFHFALPVFLLLFRDMKQAPQRLMTVALLVLLMRVADNYWTVAPSWYGPKFGLHWLYLVTPIAIGGLWFAEFVRNLRPRLEPFRHEGTAVIEPPRHHHEGERPQASDADARRSST